MGLMSWLVTHPHPRLPLEGDGAVLSQYFMGECLGMYFVHVRSLMQASIFVRSLHILRRGWSGVLQVWHYCFQ